MVRETRKSLEVREIQGILKSCKVQTPQKLNKQIYDGDFVSFRAVIICNPVVRIYLSHN